MLNNGRADETGRTIKIPTIPNYCALRLCFVQKSDKPHVIFPRTIQTLLSVSVSPQNPPLRSLLSLFPSFFHCLSDPPSTRPITPNTTRRLSSSVSFSSIPFSLTVFRPPDFGFYWVGLKCRLFRKRERKIERETKRMAGQVVKVKRERLEECMTCPLCNKLLKEATTISLCLHTFCRKCIYEKLSDEEVDYCPVCEIDLGCLPVEKLRPDHNLQDIRAKIFPLKRRKINAPEVTPSIQLPVKRKERSLSSLVVSTPKVPIQIGLTGRRTKAVARRAAALRGCTFAVEEPVKREDSAEDHSLSSSSPESQNKIVRNKMQDSFTAEPSSGQKANKETDNVVMEGKGDLWTPLNCLVEAANRTKTSKSNTQGLAVSKSEPRNFADSELRISESKTEAESRSAPDNQSYIPKTKTKEPEQTKVKNNSNGTSLLGGPVKRRRLRAANRNRAASLSGELSTSAQVILDASGANPKRRNSPIWFSLVASEDGKGDISLPQISACYLRIKDGKMPVSFIQKYLVKKLDLTSEAEVQILCRDQPVLPTLPLQNLVDLWFRTASTSKKVPASVGSSAKDFVMVLSYRRKV